MDTLMENIHSYHKHSRLAKETKQRYLSRLNDFTLFLANEMNVEKEDIYLDKIYLLKDSSGFPIRYLPIDSTLMDCYFKPLVPKGYYHMCHHHRALSNFFSFLEKNYNFKNPMYEMEFKLADYTPDKKYSRIFTRGNIIKFLNAIVSNSKDLETDLLLFCLLLSTGCRISEILGLTCENIDLENEYFLLLKTKNKDQRIVNLRPGMGEIIQRYIDKRMRKGTDFLFLINKNKKWERNDVNELLIKYLNLANLSQINIHAFRHTFATLMADEGTPINIIQQLLGHKTIKSTQGYINPHYVRNINLTLPENQLVLDGLKEMLKIKKSK